MPTLDVSDVLDSPEFADVFAVLRRAESVNNYGESVVTGVSYPVVSGVVTPTSPEDLKRLPEYDAMERHFDIVTKFRLRGPSPGYKPDIITYQGDTYVVKMVESYARFGVGFIKAIVGSTKFVDTPPPETS